MKVLVNGQFLVVAVFFMSKEGILYRIYEQFGVLFLYRSRCNQAAGRFKRPGARETREPLLGSRKY